MRGQALSFLAKLYEDDPSWRERAFCKGVEPEVFHPGQWESTAPATWYCDQCPVTAECLEYALTANIKFGVYGGKSERQRKMIRRHRARRRLIDETRAS